MVGRSEPADEAWEQIAPLPPKNWGGAASSSGMIEEVMPGIL